MHTRGRWLTHITSIIQVDKMEVVSEMSSLTKPRCKRLVFVPEVQIHRTVHVHTYIRRNGELNFCQIRW